MQGSPRIVHPNFPPFSNQLQHSNCIHHARFSVYFTLSSPSGSAHGDHDLDPGIREYTRLFVLPRVVMAGGYPRQVRPQARTQLWLNLPPALAQPTPNSG